MKKLLFSAMFILLTVVSFGQKYAYINSEYILSNMSEYKEAQAELNRVAVMWQKEIEKKFASIDSMYKKYQVEAVTMPEQIKKNREEAIIAQEKAAKDLQKKRFGQDGDLFKKREELVKPIQDRVISTVNDYAKEKGYAFVFDTAGEMTIIYADPKWDINQAILQKLGISVNNELDED
ncbi:MAG: OmpH family outer membrane protein [Bacteroidales bacterium]|nr:OmpH family outer membrane protein [Bacteroidales bacterium]